MIRYPLKHTEMFPLPLMEVESKEDLTKTQEC